MGDEITKRLLDQAIMELRIATNPHLDPAEAKKLGQDLMDRRRQLWGPTISDAPLDKAQLDLLKQRLQNTSKAIKVK